MGGRQLAGVLIGERHGHVAFVVELQGFGVATGVARELYRGALAASPDAKAWHHLTRGVGPQQRDFREACAKWGMRAWV